LPASQAIASAWLVASVPALVSRDGAQSVLIAGIDLSGVFANANADFPVINCAGVHIDAIMRPLLD
jgi:hypothetical protein